MKPAEVVSLLKIADRAIEAHNCEVARKAKVASLNRVEIEGFGTCATMAHVVRGNPVRWSSGIVNTLHGILEDRAAS